MSQSGLGHIPNCCLFLGANSSVQQRPGSYNGSSSNLCPQGSPTVACASVPLFVTRLMTSTTQDRRGSKRARASEKQSLQYLILARFLDADPPLGGATECSSSVARQGRILNATAPAQRPRRASMSSAAHWLQAFSYDMMLWVSTTCKLNPELSIKRQPEMPSVPSQ